jgi:hypothetical protein
MANPQDNKTKKTPPMPGSATGAGTGSGTGAAQPKGSAANPTPSSGHDQMNTGSMAGTGTGMTGAAKTGTGTTGTHSTGSMASPTLSGQNIGSDQPLSEKVSDTASGILDKAKEAASGTYDAVATQATSKIEEHKGELSSGLRTLADTFRKTGTDLKQTPQSTPLTDVTARYSGTAANQIEKVASYFERKDLKAMMRDTEAFARRNPAIFLGAAFALGMVAARFLKSSAPDDRTSMGSGSINSSMPTALPPAGSTGAGATRNA